MNPILSVFSNKKYCIVNRPFCNPKNPIKGNAPKFYAMSLQDWWKILFWVPCPSVLHWAEQFQRIFTK